MKKLYLILFVYLLAACSSSDTSHVLQEVTENNDFIYHYSVLKALDNGVLEGNMTVGELRKHGDHGLGTFNDEAEEVSGTLVGFWCPEFIGDINTAGFHLHFLSDDQSIGGHLMEFRATSLEIGYDTKSHYNIVLPDTEEFALAHFRSDAVNY